MLHTIHVRQKLKSLASRNVKEKKVYCFPLIKLVLDDLYKQIPLISDEQKIAAVRCKLVALASDYEMLCTGGTIDYISELQNGYTNLLRRVVHEPLANGFV